MVRLAASDSFAWLDDRKKLLRTIKGQGNLENKWGNLTNFRKNV